MSERRYTDEEVAAIFERASATERAALPATAESTGLTLAALQEIGREVGIAPELISHAARSLDMAGRPTAQKLMGLPIGVGRTVQLDQPLSDANWEHLVSDLRQTFAAQGKVRQEGSFRQWRNGNLQALLEPTPGGQRLRLQTVNGNARALMTGGLAALGVSAATLLAVTVGSGLDSAGVTGIAFMAATGIGMFVAGALRLPGWARRRRTQIDEVTARLISNSTTTKPE